MTRLGAQPRKSRMKRQMTRRASLLSTCSFLLVAACTGGDGREVLIVYSPHGPDLLAKFEDRFEAANPDVDVQWLDMGSQEVLDRLRSEKANPQADVWFGGPSSIFLAAAEEGLLVPFAPTWAAAVGEYADPAGNYHAVYLTPLIIAYNSEAIDSASAPQDWDEVLDPRWADQVLIRDPVASGTMRTMFGMVMQRGTREGGGDEAGFEWLRRLDAQTREYVLNPTLLYQKLARREGAGNDLGHAGHRGGRARPADIPLGYLFASSGTPLVEDAIAVVQGSTQSRRREAVRRVRREEEEVLRGARAFPAPGRRISRLNHLPPALRRARK